MILIKSPILPLESGTNVFSVLLRTLKISWKLMCEGLLEHPVYVYNCGEPPVDITFLPLIQVLVGRRVIKKVTYASPSCYFVVSKMGRLAIRYRWLAKWLAILGYLFVVLGLFWPFQEQSFTSAKNNFLMYKNHKFFDKRCCEID
jgi:hypothetical protein